VRGSIAILQKKNRVDSEMESNIFCTGNIFCLKQIIEKKIHITFIDLQKMYDSVYIFHNSEILVGKSYKNQILTTF